MQGPASRGRRKTVAKRKPAKKPVHASYAGMVRLEPQRMQNDLGVFDLVASAVSTNVMGYNCFSIITQGNNQGDRIGNRILVRGIQFKFQVGPLATQVGDQGARILIVYDKQANGALPSSPLPLTANYDSFKEPSARERFVILRDYLIGVGGFGQAYPGSNADGHGLVQTGYIRCELPITFGTSLGTIADTKTGSLLFCWIGNVASTGTNTWGVNYSTRVIFEK